MDRWLNHRLSRYLILLAAFAGLVVFFVRLPQADSVIGFSDFIAYWSAGRVFIDGGNPYSGEELLPVQRALGREETWPLMVWQPPWVLPFVAPLGALPFWTARALWIIINLFILAAAGDWLWRWCGGPASQAWIGLLAGLFFVPGMIALWWGQMSILVLGGLVLFLAAQEKNRDWLAGCALLLLAIKAHVPYLLFVLVALWSVRARRWRIPLAGCLAVGAATAAALLYDGEIVWRPVLTGDGPLAYRVATLGFVLRAMTKLVAMQFFPSAVAGVALLVWWWRRRAAFDWKIHAHPWLIVSTATMCYGWLYDLVLLLPPVIAMLAGVARTPFGPRSVATVGGLVIMQVLFGGLLPSVNMFTAAWWLPVLIGLLYWLAPPVRRGNTPGAM